jgi:hypothetical protein
MEEVSHAGTDRSYVGTLASVAMSAPDTSPTVTEVLRFEDLPLDSRGTRRAIARWSDGTESEALTYYADLCGDPHKSAYVDSRVMPTRASRCRARRMIATVGSG